MSDKADGRVLLPSSCTPVRYEIDITPNLVDFTFGLKQRIECVMTFSTKSITMHARELAIWSASYEGAQATSLSFDTKLTTVTFTFDSELALGKGFLTISATGQLNNQMAGFYRSNYHTIDGEEKVMASTQFESLDARRAFVCYDEPSAKAVFQISMTVGRNLTCFSNMPAATQRSLPGGELKRIDFQDSPIMSSYLVAYVVGEFDYVESISKNGVVIRVYTPEGKTSHGDFALKCACDSLDIYDEFFGIPYPLPKLDMVGIPEFAMGAMENWGLVTYREVDILIDPVKASAQQRNRVCTVVTHELAHQWFGNLVTMAWWDDIWLNEGFASWTENFAADLMFPEWKVWEQFAVGHAAAALRLDSMRSSHPIQVPIRHAEEVEEVFDAISYCKGSCVIKMLHAVLGREDFQKGLVTYMNQYKYSNTETYMLWLCWETASGLPVNDIMKSWTEQMGFPLLKVDSYKVENSSAIITVSQSWFIADGSMDPSNPNDVKTWSIPIIASSAAGVSEDIQIMRSNSLTFTVPLSSPSDFVKLNSNQEVPMRVLYNSEMLKHLSVAVSSKTLSAVDRAGLLADAYALVKSGDLDPAELIKLLHHYKNETDFVVYEAVAGVLGGLAQTALLNENITEHLEKFATSLVSVLLEHVGWEEKEADDDNAKLLRGTLISLLAKFCYKEPGVRQEAARRFAKFLVDPSDMANLPSDMRPYVFKIVLKNGGLKEYEQVLSYFTTATDNAERKHVLSALGAAPDIKLKERTIEWTTSGAVKLQDCFYALGSVHYSGKAGAELAWKFLTENLPKLQEMLGNASASLLQACISSCCGGFASAERADEVEHFFKGKELAQCERKIAQTVEGIRSAGKNVGNLERSQLTSEAFWTQFK